jgi:two-component system CheB/CheR fusion protein
LFLGSSESADNVPSLFFPIDKKRRIYRRRDVVGIVQSNPPPLLPGKWQVNIPAIEGSRQANPSVGQLHYELLESLGPPSVLVNEAFEIVHSSRSAWRYLRFAGGEPTRNLLKLVEPGFQFDLRSALMEAKALADGHAGVSRKLHISRDGETRWLNLSVRLITSGPQVTLGYFLVFFDETTEAAQPDLQSDDVDSAKRELVGQLEQELQQLKDQLRIQLEQHETSTEELRASNEELQAINEELRSATEELETSKEELQSVNEELSTVNQEYKEKIDEVGRTNSDLQNLMSSTEIATIFLDRAFQIKRNTSKAQELFNITPSDVGRPLEHFTNKLDYAGLHEDAQHVLNALQPIEREVRSADGLWFLARLTPYRTMDDKIDGVVLTFVDITNGKRFEEQLEQQTAELREQAEILKRAYVIVLDAERRILVWNSACEKIYGYT